MTRRFTIVHAVHLGFYKHVQIPENLLFSDGPDDWLVFIMREGRIIFGVLICIVGSFFTGRVGSVKWSRVLRCALLIFALALLLVFVRDASGKEMLLALLGTEDDPLAEQAYWRLQKIADIDWLVAEINSDGSDEINVKFYLSRMLGCALRDVDTQTKAKILASLSQEPVQTVFFAKNDLNQEVDFTYYDGVISRLCPIPSPLTPQSIAKYYSEKGDDPKQAKIDPPKGDQS
jgi:hypothetical protein